MGDIIPLSYRSVTGATVAPGSILVAQASDGSIGGWVEPPTVDLIDPAANPSIAMTEVVAAYNRLIWGLATASVIKSDPVIEFGAAGDMGVNISVNGISKGVWAPGSTTKLTITEIIEELNELCDPASGVMFRYISGRRPYLRVADGAAIQFSDPDRATRPDTAAHIMNRVLNGISTGIDGPMSVIGAAITDAFGGVYTAPASVTDIVCNPGMFTIDVSWTASPDAVKYFVRIVGGGHNDIVETTDTSYPFVALTADTDYEITVIASSLYELSVGDVAVPVHTTPPPPRIIPLLFGPIDSGKSSSLTTTISNNPNSPYQIGYRVPYPVPGTTDWVGYAFNTLLFPPVDGTPTLLGNSGNSTSIRALVYNGPPLNASGPEAFSDIITIDGIINMSSPPSYMFRLNNTITLGPNTYIMLEVFGSTPTDVATFNDDILIPLVGVFTSRDETGQSDGTFDFSPFQGMLTNFALLPVGLTQSSTLNSITIDWPVMDNMFTDVDRLVLTLREEGGGDPLSEVFKQISDATHTFDNLAAGKNYTIEAKFVDATLTRYGYPLTLTETIPNIVYQVADNGSNVSGMMAILSDGNIFGMRIPAGSTTIGKSINAIYFSESIVAQYGEATIIFKVFTNTTMSTLVTESNTITIKEPSGFYDFTTSQGTTILPNEWQTAYFTFSNSITLAEGMFIACIGIGGPGRVYSKYVDNGPFDINYFRKNQSGSFNTDSNFQSYVYALTS